MKDQAKGTIVEVEYKPPYSAHLQCYKLLDEFLGYLGPFDTDIQQYINAIDNTTGLETNTTQHTAPQYVSAFKSMGILTK